MRIVLVLLFCVCYGIGFCQDTTAVQSRQTISFGSVKTNKKVRKAIKIFSYLNYCDIRIDRPIADALAFECYKGKIIRRVEVEVVYPYGVSLDSPYAYHPTRLQALANKVQFSTRDQVIKNEILFHEGDALDPAIFADTEKNLWEKNIYKDIRIIIEEVGDDMVDVTVFVRDRWNIGLITSASYNNVQVGVQLNNLFGLSQTVQVDGTFYFRTFAAYHMHLGYVYTNIYSSFINVAVNGSYDILNQAGSFNINRNFFSAKTEWAGRILINATRNNLVLPTSDTKFINAWVATASEDLWIAHAVKLGGDLSLKFPLIRLITSARIQRTDYINRPYLYSPGHIINFVDQDNILGSIGIARWDYYVDHNVYSLDKAEYFTKGISVAIIGGFQNDEILLRRTYLAAALQYGVSFINYGYLLSFLKAGAFVNPNTVDQGLIDWENTFYTIPVKMGKWNMRSFINTNVKIGFSRPPGDDILVNNLNGLRGVNSLYLRGIHTYGLSYEADFYYTKKILGFSTSYFVFSDLSIYQQTASDHHFQSGVGVGFRTRNLNFGIGFLEVTFAYYPHLNVPDQQQFNVLGNVISNRTPIKKDLFGPDILNVD